MAPERVFQPIVAESSSGSSTAVVETPNHPGHPDYISPDHDPYNVNRHFEPLHGPLDTSRTYNDTGFEPIPTYTSARPDVEVRPGDRAELQRIASAGTVSRVNTRASRGGTNLYKKDTYADVTLEDPALDPSSPDFVSAAAP